MKITLTQTGGWANIPLRCTVDTDTMPGDVAETLERIVRAGTLFRPSVDGRRVADGFQYILTVEDDAGERVARFDEFGQPGGAEQMLRVLRPLCRPAPSLRGG